MYGYNFQKSHRSIPPISILASSRISTSQSTLRKEDSRPIPAPQQQQPQQQVSPPWFLSSSRDYRAAGEATTAEKRSNDDEVNIGFVQRNGNIVPADPNELKETTDRQSLRNDQKEQKDVVERPSVEKTIPEERNAKSDEEQRKQVMSPSSLIRDNDSKKEIPTVMTASVFQAEQPSSERVSKPAVSKSIKIPTENNELQAL